MFSPWCTLLKQVRAEQSHSSGDQNNREVRPESTQLPEVNQNMSCVLGCGLFFLTEPKNRVIALEKCGNVEIWMEKQNKRTSCGDKQTVFKVIYAIT